MASGHTEPHVGSLASYFAVFGTLMVLTVLTVLASKFNMGVWVAIIIAMAKTSVVVLYFMHVKYSSPLIKLTAACGFVWLLFLFGLTFTDYIGRTMIDPPKSWITPKVVAAVPAAAHKE
jgi:cytochrome c oxidase subunit IV